MANNISIKDIAKMANVSVATVSRVINQNGRFSKETENRVREIVEKYDYKPNALARGLRVEKARVVGVIVPDITQEFFSSIAREIESELLNKGYLAIICDTNENLELEKKYIEMLLSIKIGGIIYVSGDEKIEPVEGIPAVYVDRRPEFMDKKEGSCFIGSDNQQGGYLATKRLLEAGRKNIAIVLHDKTIATQERRLRGYRSALQEKGIRFDEKKVFKVDYIDMQHGYDVTQKIWETSPDIDGIFYSTDLLAIGGLSYLNEKKIEVPEKVSLVGFDDIALCSKVSPALTTIRQPYQEFGRMAAEIIVKMMDGDMDYRKCILGVELIERETV